MRRIYLSETDKKISGVCGGIAEYLGVDSTIIRLIWVLLSFFTVAFPGIIAYIVASLIIPKENFQ